MFAMFEKLLTRRWFFTGMFLACVALLGFGLILQHAWGLEPCPLCIFQRIAFMAVGVVALIGALHNPAGWGRHVYSSLVLVSAVVGGAIAVRHIWIQYFPPPARGCGADFDYLMDLPLSYALPSIFRGTGDCAEVSWRFLWLSIPEWALVWFVLFAAAAIVTFRLRR